MIPPEQNARFVWKMEQVLQVYKRPFNPLRPVVGFDRAANRECPKQLIREVRQPLRLADGTTRYDYDRVAGRYERKRVSNIFMAVEPLAGKRKVKVYERRTKKEWVAFMSYLAEQVYAEAEYITIILDNLNTHDPAAFYEFYPAAKAKALLDRFEFVYTPEHGSWLNVAECELSVLMNQCLNRRIAHVNEVRTEIEAWQQDRNNRKATINWPFEDKDARIKLRHLYPNI